jgi:subtilisin family serine protease
MRHVPRPLPAALAAVLTIGGLAGLTPAAPAAGGTDPTVALGGPRERVIVQLDEPAALRRTGPAGQPLNAASPAAMRSLDTARADVRQEQRDVLAAARTAGVDVRQLHAYTDLIAGLAVSVPAGGVDELRRLAGVRAVSLDQPMRMSTDVSVPLVGTPQVWERTDAEGQPVRGEGVTVAILDTGIDYNLDSLGGGFGPEYKVVDGYDFANDDADPMDGNGHGTHVAGIVAGNGSVTGVAPEASLTAYKVLGDDGGGFESDIIAGLEAAVAPDNPHRADVINMSLGGPGDGREPIGLAATAATREGAVVVAAAGNSGPAPGTVGTPAAADGVISVGASVSGVRVPTAYVESPRHQLLQAYRGSYSANPPEQPISGELVDVGRGTDADYERVGDVTGKVVAIQSTIPGSIEQTSPFYLDQARRAEERGAIALIGYVRSFGGPLSTGQGPQAAAETAALADVPLKTAASGDSFRMDKIVVLGVDALQWQELQGFLAEGPVEISIAGEDLTDRVAAFSSQGPTSRFTLEPDLVAPGVEIRSTWPSAQWAPGEFRISGTSMAAPHVAGAAALLRQLRPDDTVADMAGALIGSAKALDDLGPTAQGAGRLDVAAAADATVTAQPTSISMGLADMSRETVDANGSVRLVNHSDAGVTVALSAQSAPNSPGTAAVSPTSATIPAGGSVEVTVRVSADTPATDTEVSGWVRASVDGAPDVRVPYLLSVRPMIVQASPDPGAGTSEAFVYSPTALAQPPTLTVRSPSGGTTTVPMTLDHGTWYRVRVDGDAPGTYRLDAGAWTTGGVRLIGSGALEMLARDNRPGGDRWEPIGPNGEAGDISTTAADADTAVVTQYTKTGPWITNDGARTWRQVDRLPVAAGDGTVIVDASDPDRMWYAISGEAGSFFKTLLDPTYHGKVLRSTDGGRTWRTMDFPDTQVYAFVSDPATRVLAAVTADAIVLSRDGGRTWSSFASPLSGDELLDAGVGDGNLYLSGFNGVWSVSGILDGVPDGTAQVYESNDPNIRGMIADDELVGVLDWDNRLVGSRDGGRTWDVIHQFPSSGPWSIAMRGGTILVGTFQADDYISRDHGVTWSNVPRPLRGPLEVDFTPWGDGSLLFAAEGGGLMRTGADGSSPTRVGVQGVNAYDVAVSERPDGSPVLLAGTDSDVYRTSLPVAKNVTPSMTEWGLSGFEGFNGTTVNHVVASPSEPGVLWKVRQDATGSFWVYRSSDGGATWQVRGRDRQVAFDLGISSLDTQRVVVPFGALNGVGLFATRDGGATWKKLFHDQVFTDVAMDPADPDRLWLGSASGLYRSDDFGQTVTKVASGRVSAVAIDGQRIVAGGDRILVSDDGGETFRAADTGGLSMWVSDLVAVPSGSGPWYASTTSYTANGLVRGGRGVLRSTDGGRTWVNVSGGLQNLAVESLAASPDGQWLFAGTYQGGVHRLPIG